VTQAQSIFDVNLEEHDPGGSIWKEIKLNCQSLTALAHDDIIGCATTTNSLARLGARSVVIPKEGI
jgi:hypothetical protein